MKKNTMMRLASILLVAVMLSTCAISGTFAKYVTTDSASDTARVAKWGVILQVDGSLYGQQSKDTPIAAADDTTITVQVNQSGTKENIVAPGTKNESTLHFAINGQPEVDNALTATIEVENIYLNTGKYGVMVEAGTVTAESFVANTYYAMSGTNYVLASSWTKDTTYYTLEDEVDLKAIYYPVIYTLTGDTTNGTSYTSGATTADSLKAIAEAIAKQLNDGTAVSAPTSTAAGKYTYTLNKVAYDSNEDLTTTIKLADEDLSWAWAFSGQNDEADTILGHLMAAPTTGTVVKETATAGTFAAPTAASGTELNDYNLETSFSMNITIEQVD